MTTSAGDAGSPEPESVDARDLAGVADGFERLWTPHRIAYIRGERPAKAALSEQYRSSDQLASFKAGRCRGCGTVQFPQLAYCVNPACHAPAEQFEPYRLVDEPARVLTFTADWLSFHPAPPLYVGFVQFDVGARLLMEMVDVAPGSLDVGVPLRTVFRIKERDSIRGYNRYFWKTTPIHL